MPKFYCDYCDTYLTHNTPSVRKTHCNGKMFSVTQTTKPTLHSYRKKTQGEREALLPEVDGGPGPVIDRRHHCRLHEGETRQISRQRHPSTSEPGRAAHETNGSGRNGTWNGTRDGTWRNETNGSRGNATHGTDGWSYGPNATRDAAWDDAWSSYDGSRYAV